ncbi:hypothetical protein pb186bvf_012749 [Paramecium bursaria]
MRTLIFSTLLIICSACDDDCERTKLILIVITCCICGPLLLCFIWFILSRIKYRMYIKKKKQLLFQQYLSSLNPVDKGLDQDFMNYFTQKKWNMQYTQRLKENRVAGLQITYQNLNNSHNFIMKGRDNSGTWMAEGYLISDSEPKLWMMKFYKDKPRAQQVGQYKHLIYYGEFDKQLKLVNGRWYFHGHMNHPNYSGTWSMNVI